MFIVQGLPPDVKSVYYSGMYFYAASVDKVSDQSKAVGCGNTQEEAIQDMRRLVSAYLPLTLRASLHKRSDRYAVPEIQGS